MDICVTDLFITNSILGKTQKPNKDALGIIGISPFSSFFTYEKIKDVVEWVDHHCKSYKLFIPDVPTVYSLQSLGYKEHDAIKKAKKQCRYLKNKCEKALIQINRHNIADSIIDYDFLQEELTFKNKLNEILSLYNSSKKFKDAVDSFSLEFLLKNEVVPSKLSIKYSSLYLLYELPIFIYANQIFEVDDCFFMYPQCPSFIKNILKEELDVGIKTNQDFLEYKIWR